MHSVLVREDFGTILVVDVTVVFRLAVDWLSLTVRWMYTVGAVF